jgi:hypothetical protein
MIRTDGVQTQKVSPNFLTSCAEVHDRTPFTAFGDLTDNSKDAGATLLQILYSEEQTCLRFHDNGPGLEYDTLVNMFGWGYSSSKEGAMKSGQYGMGFKSSVMRLGKDALAITQTAKSRSVAFLSRSLHAGEQKDLVLVPALRYTQDKKSGLWELPKNDQGTSQSLQLIFKYSSVKSLRELEEEFAYFTGTGMRILIDNVTSAISEYKDEDIRCNRSEEDLCYLFDVSLREYLSWIYSTASCLAPSRADFSIHLNGEAIRFYNLDQELHHRSSKTTKGHGKTDFAKLGKLKLLFGFTAPLADTPGSKPKTIANIHNRPCGMLVFQGGRAVELFKPFREPNTTIMDTIAIRHRRGVGGILVVELPKNPKGREINLAPPTANKDGFCSSDTLVAFFKKMDEKVREMAFRCR